MSLRALFQVSVVVGLALWASQSLAATPLRVTGRVTDWTQESGIAGAKVELLPAYEGPTRPAALASARTDAEGSFEITAPEDGCFRLVVRAEGYLVMEHPLAPLVEDRQLPTTGLVPSHPFEVRAVGANGRPVAGAEVRILPQKLLGSDRPWGWRVADRKGVTGPDGKVSLPIHERESLEVTAAAPGFLEQSVPLAPPSATLRLSPAPKPLPGTPSKPATPRRISGRVTDAASGKPVAGALVWSGWPLVAPPVRADAEGRFQLDVPPGDGHWLESAAAGFLPAERRYVSQGNTAPVLVKLDPATEISGRVNDPAGRPVPGVSLQIDPPRPIDPSQDFSEVRGGADGRFRFTGLKPGTAYKLTARREGFERTLVPVRTSPTGQPPPPPLQIVLGEGKTLLGRIVDAEDRPVPGFNLVLFDRLTYRDLHKAATNAEGRFEIRHLSPDTYMLMAQHPDHPGLDVPEVEIPPTAPSVNLGDLKLPAEGAIEGRVTDTRGTPVEGAEIHVFPSEEHGDSLSFGVSLNSSGHPSLPSLRSVRTGPDGSFRARGLKSGELFDLRVTHPDHPEASLSGIEIPTREPLRIELKSGHRLSGQVVNSEGEPVAGASLTWVESAEGIAGLFGSQRPLGVTDAEGRFQVDRLPAGRLDLEISATGYQTRWLEGLRIPDEGDLDGVKAVLGRGCWLDIRAYSAEGEPLPGAYLMARPKDMDNQQNLRALMLQSFSHCQTDSHGRCRLSLQEPGAYAVSLVQKSFTVNVTAAPGGTPVEIRLPRGFEVSGRVIGQDGAGVPDTFVESQSENQEPGAVKTEADGSFVFPGRLEGRHRLSVRQPGVGEASLDVEVTGQPVSGLELRLSATEPTAVLTGRLTGLPPEDFQGAFVHAQSADTGFETGRVERDGSYRIDGLEPGEWTVQARTASGRRTEGRIRIEPRVTAPILDLDFATGLTLTGSVLVDGAPAAGASVLAGNRDSAGSGRHHRTAYDGSFTLRDLQPGPLTLLVFGSPGISTARMIQLEENGEITIEITTGTFKATVLSTAGEPLEGAVATLEPWVEETEIPFAAVSVRSTPDGTLDAGRLAPGTYRMEIRKEGFQPRKETVEIRPGGVTVLDLRLSPRE